MGYEPFLDNHYELLLMLTERTLLRNCDIWNLSIIRIYYMKPTRGGREKNAHTLLIWNSIVLLTRVAISENGKLK